MPWPALDDQQEKAKKILGDGAIMPPLKVDIEDLKDKVNETAKKFAEERDKLEDIVEKIEDGLDAVKNGVKRVAADYETNTFGLDQKKDAKKIEQARKIFSAFFADRLKTAANSVKDLDELQKHLSQVGTYKGPRP